jgi:hypothetical protein
MVDGDCSYTMAMATARTRWRLLRSRSATPRLQRCALATRSRWRTPRLQASHSVVPHRVSLTAPDAAPQDLTHHCRTLFDGAPQDLTHHCCTIPAPLPCHTCITAGVGGRIGDICCATGVSEGTTHHWWLYSPVGIGGEGRWGAEITNCCTATGVLTGCPGWGSTHHWWLYLPLVALPRHRWLYAPVLVPTRAGA